MTIKDKVSMIFCTCDAYSDLWDNFFFLLRKCWPEFDANIILNTESKVFRYDGLTISEPLNCGTDLSWSERLAKSLDKAETNHVLIMLEDFYLKGRVDHSEFCKSLAFMQDNPEVAYVTYLREPGACKPIDSLPGFFLRKQFSIYKMTAHITLYRKDYLRSLLKKGESAWEFEVNGTIRSWFKYGKCFCPPNNRRVVFPYDFGSLCIRGEFYGPVKRYFEEKEGLVFSANRQTIEELPVSHGAKLSRKLYYLTHGLLSVFAGNA